MQFNSTGAFAGQYWSGKVSYNLADILTLATSDGPVHGGVDATLDKAATISGTVTGPTGKPAGNVCVYAEVDTTKGSDWVGGATPRPTAPTRSAACRPPP